MTQRPFEDDTLGFPAVVNTTRRDWLRDPLTWIIVALIALVLYAPNAQACTVPPTATVKGHRIKRDQRINTTKALRLADHMHAPFKHEVAVVAAATQEDSQHNRAGGHGTSVGYLQLINIHGTVAWRMRVENSAGWFLRAARSIDPRGTARLATTHRHGPGLIQRIQRSGYPAAYNDDIAEAARTVKQYRATC